MTPLLPATRTRPLALQRPPRPHPRSATGTPFRTPVHVARPLRGRLFHGRSVAPGMLVNRSFHGRLPPYALPLRTDAGAESVRGTVGSRKCGLLSATTRAKFHLELSLPLDLPDVPPLDVEAAAAAALVREQLPVGAFGIWGAVIDLLAAARGSTTGPLAPRRPQLVVFAADHGIAELEVSAAIDGETARRGAGPMGGRGFPAGRARGGGG